MSRRSRPLAALALFVASAVALLPGRPAAAAGEEHIRNFAVSLDADQNGALHVTEVIDYDFGANQRHGIYRYVPVRFHYDAKYDRVYRMTAIHVTASPGTPTHTKLSDSNNNKVIKIGDANKTITGLHQYTITYDVAGAFNHFEDHEELYWNAIGDRWDVPIDRAVVTVHTPAAITKLACFAGPAHSSLPCADATGVGQPQAGFASSELGPSEAVTVVVAVPVGAIAHTAPMLDERWSFQRAFAVTGSTIAGALALALALGFLVLRLLWRHGRDRRSLGDEGVTGLVPAFGNAEPPVEFRPPDDLRPAQVGVLVDETADPLDVTASIVDLAVRGYLSIEELPHHGMFSKGDWKLTRLKDDDASLQPFEQRLLDGLFATGSEVNLSALKNHFYDDLKKVQADLYDDCVAQGWFAGRPDTTRGNWFALGLIAALVGIGVLVLLAATTHAGLVGVPVALAGLAVLVAHNHMPARTAKGTDTLQHVLGFRRFITTAETERMQFAEETGVFAKYLPYAIVFGATKQWAKRFEGLDATSPAMAGMGWYMSPYPFNPIGFSDRMNDFTVHTAGTIVSTPPSASGGSGFGGFSGGGGGGGGGGSW